MSLLAQVREQVRSFMRPRTLGERGEAATARFLKRLGYVIVARGQRDNLGEIDLVAVEGRTVVFVEVKTRKSLQTGHPADAVDENKQRKLTRLGLSFLKRHDLLECSARFDVVAVLWPDGEKQPKIDHFKDAFEPAGNWQMFS